MEILHVATSNFRGLLGMSSVVFDLASFSFFGDTILGLTFNLLLLLLQVFSIYDDVQVVTAIFNLLLHAAINNYENFYTNQGRMAPSAL